MMGRILSSCKDNKRYANKRDKRFKSQVLREKRSCSSINILIRGGKN